MIDPSGITEEPPLLFDLHTHILPGIDDGSRSCAESVSMLESMKHQNVRHIAATPHFYARFQSPEEFLAERAVAWEHMKQEPICAEFDIRLGAEVQYYEGLTRLEQPERFCIEGTKLFLLEMPFVPWDGRMLSVVREMTENSSLHIMIAHIDRYMKLQPRKLLQSLMDMDVLLQCNTEFVLSHRTRNKAVHMMKRGLLHAIGSDCHNSGTRAPNVGQAMKILEERKAPVEDFLVWQRELLGDGGVRI